MDTNKVVNNIPIKGAIISDKYNCIINMDEIGKELMRSNPDNFDNSIILPNHEDILPVIIKNYYFEEYGKFCDIDQRKIKLDKNECGVDNNEMLFCIFLSSIGETVFINGSDEEDTILLNDQKDSIYTERNFYNFGAQIYLPENIDDLSPLVRETLNDYKPGMDLMVKSSLIEGLLVPPIDELETKEMIEINYNDLFESLNHKKNR